MNSLSAGLIEIYSKLIAFVTFENIKLIVRCELAQKWNEVRLAVPLYLKPNIGQTSEALLRKKTAHFHIVLKFLKLCPMHQKQLYHARVLGSNCFIILSHQIVELAFRKLLERLVKLLL